MCLQITLRSSWTSYALEVLVSALLEQLKGEMMRHWRSHCRVGAAHHTGLHERRDSAEASGQSCKTGTLNNEPVETRGQASKDGEDAYRPSLAGIKVHACFYSKQSPPVNHCCHRDKSISVLAIQDRPQTGVVRVCRSLPFSHSEILLKDSQTCQLAS